MVIDTDAHVEEHEGMFAELAEDPRWESVRPRVVKGPDRAFWMIEDRLVPRPHGWASMTAGTPHLIEPGHVEDAARRSIVGSQQLTEPGARLEEMKSEGIDYSVVFPTLFLLYPLADNPDLYRALCRSYNNWMAKTCEKAGERLLWVATVNLEDVEGAMMEMERTAKMGAMGVQILGTAGEKNLDHPDLEPFWALAERIQIPVCVHVGWPLTSLNRLYSNVYTSIAAPFVIPLFMAFTALIGGKVLDRHPGLKVGFFEGGIEWVPYWLDRLERFYRQPPGNSPRSILPDRAPQEYFRDGNLFFSCELDEHRIQMVADAIGNDCILYASDLPHSHRVFDAVETFRRREDIDAETKQKILCDNGLKFYAGRMPAKARG